MLRFLRGKDMLPHDIGGFCKFPDISGLNDTICFVLVARSCFTPPSYALAGGAPRVQTERRQWLEADLDPDVNRRSHRAVDLLQAAP